MFWLVFDYLFGFELRFFIAFFSFCFPVAVYFGVWYYVFSCGQGLFFLRAKKGVWGTFPQRGDGEAVGKWLATYVPRYSKIT